MRRYRCSDRMCGATDCDRCYPGNTEGYPCEECGELFDDCKCEEFVLDHDPDYDEDEREAIKEEQCERMMAYYDRNF